MMDAYWVLRIDGSASNRLPGGTYREVENRGLKSTWEEANELANWLNNEEAKNVSRKMGVSVSKGATLVQFHVVSNSELVEWQQKGTRIK